MNYFYDTSSLLTLLDKIFTQKQKFLISNLTLKELENIKTSFNKDNDIKYKARKLIHLLENNENQYDIINYQSSWNKELKNCLLDNIDSRIILCAKHCHKKIIFITDDLFCRQLAKSVGLITKDISKEDNSKYIGYKELSLNNTNLNDFYSNKNFINNLDLFENEYLLIKDINNNEIDKYKFINSKLEKITYPIFNSKIFGKIKPKDSYQLMAMDSLKTNQITMLRGTAGTGKSYLAMGFLFDKLEKGEIDRIIIFCNTVATAGSAKLGYYPGSRNEKLLDSQIGNFLISKLGDKSIVDSLISNNKLVLLPMSDIRGYDTTGMKAGIYITEAQNLDIELIRLALQRIGEDCICIIDGDDESQVDMPMYAGANNGMKRVSEIFRGDSIYGEITLKNIYRSHIAELASYL